MAAPGEKSRDLTPLPTDPVAPYKLKPDLLPGSTSARHRTDHVREVRSPACVSRRTANRTSNQVRPTVVWFLALALSLIAHVPAARECSRSASPADPLAARLHAAHFSHQPTAHTWPHDTGSARYVSGPPQDGYAAWLEGRTRPGAADSAPPGTIVRATRPAPPTSTPGQAP